MSLNCKVGTLTQKTTTGNQATTGVGFQPQALVLWCNDRTSDGTHVGQVFAIGFAASATQRAAVCLSAIDAGDNTDERHDNTKCLTLINSSTTVTLAADLVSFDSDGFTLNFTTTDGGSRVIHYLALGGDDLTNVAVKQFSSGDTAVTGVGFMPDALIVISNDSATVPPGNTAIAKATIGFGCCIAGGTLKYRGNAVTGVVAADSTSAARRTHNRNAIYEVSSTLGGLFNSGRLESLDSDGFTLSWPTLGSSGRYAWALCLKGGTYRVFADGQKTSTGTQATTLPGLRPSGVVLTSFNATAGSETTISRLSVGAASGPSARGCTWAGKANGASSAADSDLDTAAVLKMFTEGTPTLNAEADLSSFDASGFTLNWSTADATAREFVGLAFGDTNQPDRVLPIRRGSTLSKM